MILHHEIHSHLKLNTFGATTVSKLHATTWIIQPCTYSSGSLALNKYSFAIACINSRFLTHLNLLFVYILLSSISCPYSSYIVHIDSKINRARRFGNFIARLDFCWTKYNQENNTTSSFTRTSLQHSWPHL